MSVLPVVRPKANRAAARPLEPHQRAARARGTVAGRARPPLAGVVRSCTRSVDRLRRDPWARPRQPSRGSI